jgi:ADP-ribosylglycohydrolase
MALCLAASLVECGGFDARDQVERYLRWLGEGYMSSTGVCFDIGTTVRTALGIYQQTGEPFSGPTHTHSAGNGSIMRLAPIPLFFLSNPRLAIEMAVRSSRTTHGALEAVDACRYMAGLIVGGLQGHSKDDLLSPGFCPVPDLWNSEPLAPAIAEIAAGSFKVKDPPEIEGSGYVVKSLEAALWAFDRSQDFREGALKAANLGDDADTTGTVYGQLAGAYYGEAGIPGAWLGKLALRQTIVELADGLWRGSKQVDLG